LVDGWLDLAIDLGGASIGHIQTFVPPGRPLPPGTFEIGISLREHARGQGYGREALALLTNWLFEHAGAAAAEAETDPANTAMRTVFQRVGWTMAGRVIESGREWMTYRITRPQWDHDRSRATPSPRVAELPDTDLASAHTAALSPGELPVTHREVMGLCS